MKSIAMSLVLAAVGIVAAQSKPFGTPEQRVIEQKGGTKAGESHEGQEAQQPSPVTVIVQQDNAAQPNAGNKNSGEDVDLERKIVKYTGYLVWVGIATVFFIGYQSWATAQAAKAARDGVELQISKERGRVKIGVQDAKVFAAPSQNIATWLENYGPSIAFVKEFRARYLATPDRIVVPDYSNCKLVAFNEWVKPEYTKSVSEQGQVKYGIVPMEPFKPFTEDDVMDIRKELSFIHFYGFARYRDLFDRNWRVNIHVRWKMRWGGTTEGTIMAWWETKDLREADNTDVSEDVPTPKWWKFHGLRKAIEAIKQTGQNPN